MARAVCGVLEHPPAAHAAVQDLLDSGFLRENISVVAREGSEGAGDPGSTPLPAAPPSGASAGAGAGTALGGVAGLLLGLGALAIPGLGPLVAAGPLAAALAGAGAGAVAGGLIGALTDLGVPEDEACSYVDDLRRGGVLLVVRAEGMMIERATSRTRLFRFGSIRTRAAVTSTAWLGCLVLIKTSNEAQLNWLLRDMVSL